MGNTLAEVLEQRARVVGKRAKMRGTDGTDIAMFGCQVLCQVLCLIADVRTMRDQVVSRVVVNQVID